MLAHNANSGAMVYQYSWVNGTLIAGTPELLEELSTLYSEHYGIWGENAPRPAGTRVALSSRRLGPWLTSDSMVAMARIGGVLVGYAIVVRAKARSKRIISWVTQFVVHQDHRRRGVGKTLLFSIWEFSDHFAWGLITANPYAVRALEKATRRRVVPAEVAIRKDTLLNVGTSHVPYITEETAMVANRRTSAINTKFFIDHSKLPTMLEGVTKPDTPWTLGDIEDGWEWLAFTFNEQQMIGLSEDEIEKMLGASDQVVKLALSRMALDSSHSWTRYTPVEVQLIMEYCAVGEGANILDLGCGNGRHSLELAARGIHVTGADYLENLIGFANQEAENRHLQSIATFLVEDCRYIDLGRTYDAVVSLYDVIGTYANDADNALLLGAIGRHLKPGGFALISVMNYELTEAQAQNHFTLTDDPDALLRLAPSRTMEQTGNIFDPKYYLIESNTRVVYRKEQFDSGNELPMELTVRDRRYRQDEIEAMCRAADLDVIWSRFVGLGKWEEPLDATDIRAKEILVLCKKPTS